MVASISSTYSPTNLSVTLCIYKIQYLDTVEHSDETIKTVLFY